MMLVHAMSLSFYYIIIELLSNRVHPLQTYFMYSLIMFICISLSCVKQGFKVHLKTNFLKYHIIRGCLSSFATLFLFFSISVIGVSDVTALSKLEHSFMILVGVFLFNEKFTKQKFILLSGNLLAIMLLVDFKKLTNSQGYLYMIVALLFWILNNIYIKKLTFTERSRSQLFYSSLFAVLVNSLMIFVVAFLPTSFQSQIGFVWSKVNLKILLFIFSLALTKFLHKLMFFNAYKFCDISIVSHFDYSRLIFTSLLAFIFFNKVPNLNEIAGYLTITIAGIYFVVSFSKQKG